MTEPIDFRLLTPEEAKHLRAVRVPDLTLRERIRHYPRTLLAVLLCIVVWVPALIFFFFDDPWGLAPILSIPSKDLPNSDHLLFILIGISLLAIILPTSLLLIFSLKESDLLLVEAKAAYLDSIGYGSRTLLAEEEGGASEPPAAGRDSSENKSKRRRQHEFYEGHRELTWRDRELANTLDLDADTYISNVLERE